MIHQRTIIRNRLAEILTAGGVVNVKTQPLSLLTLILHDLPTLGIMMMSDTVVEETAGPRERTNEIAVVFEGVVVPGDDTADKMDALDRQVMDVLDADRYLGGTPREYTLDVRRQGAEMVHIRVGEQPTGYLATTYVFEYLDRSPEPATVPDSLKTLDTTYNPDGNTDPGNQPGDRQTFPGG